MFHALGQGKLENEKHELDYASQYSGEKPIENSDAILKRLRDG